MPKQLGKQAAETWNLTSISIQMKNAQQSLEEFKEETTSTKCGKAGRRNVFILLSGFCLIVLMSKSKCNSKHTQVKPLTRFSTVHIDIHVSTHTHTHNKNSFHACLPYCIFPGVENTAFYHGLRFLYISLTMG